jgi:threonine aldolase
VVSAKHDPKTTLAEALPALRKRRVARTPKVTELDQAPDVRSDVATDNRRAAELAERLSALDGVAVEPPPTNLVFLAADGVDADTLLTRLAERGVLGYRRDERRVRFVTHREVDDGAVEQAVAAVAAAVRAGP